MKIEKINKDNINEFVDNVISAKELVSNINKIEYYAVSGDNKYLLGFEMLSEEDRISIKYVNEIVDENKFINIINYLKTILVVKNHLIIELYNKKYINIMDENYKCKELYVSLYKSEIKDENNKCKEELAEIDMYNIRYLSSKNEIICNLVKQNIQDEKIILELNSIFIEKDSGIVSFVISSNLSNLFNELGYELLYKAYVISNS